MVIRVMVFGMRIATKGLNKKEFLFSVSWGKNWMMKGFFRVMFGLLLFGEGCIGALAVTNIAYENQAPDAPTIMGPSNVKVGVVHTWSFTSSDPEGENITYYVDWGDQCGGAQWFGPFPSGETLNVTHTYLVKNTFIINALARDAEGAESNMTYFPVKIPKCDSGDFLWLGVFERLFNRLIVFHPFF
jgi:hypothetical protein